MRWPRYVPQRRAPAGPDAGEILLAHDAARATDGLDDGPRDGTAPDRGGARRRDALQGSSELRLANPGAERRDVRPSVRSGPEEDAGGLGIAPQALQPAGGHLAVLRAHHHTLASEADGRGEDRGTGQRASLLQEGEVAVHRVGDGDRQPTVGG